MKLDGYYGEFSSDVRKKLLAKNLPTVSNIYDVLYAKTRENMLASNVPLIQGSIEDISDAIRLNELKNNIKSSLNFDAINEQARTQNESRNTLVTNVSNLETIGDKKREELLSKNSISIPTIDSYAEGALKNEQASNKSTSLSIDTYAPNALSNEQSSNKPTSLSIDTYAPGERINEENANVPIKTNIDTYAPGALANEQTSNKPTTINIDTYAGAELKNESASNIPATVNIDTYAPSALKNESTSNVPIVVNIDTYAGAELKSEQKSNVPTNITIDTYATPERADELTSNSPATVNIDSYALGERANELTSNVPATVNIDSYAPGERTNEENANTPAVVNIDTYATNERVDELSSNTPALTNIDTWASNERVDELSSNTPALTDIDTWAAGERTDELSSNTPAQTDIDTWAAGERTDELSSNTPALTDIDTWAAGERTDELSSNTPALTDIDTWAAGERTDELSSNTPAQVDIDTYAPSALASEESANTPVQVNIDTYAPDALNNETSVNVPSKTNIDFFVDTYGNLITSDDFRDSMLSKNKDFVLGVDVAFGGTSAFLGVSNLLIQGAIISNIMTIPNQYHLLGHQYSGPTGVNKPHNTQYHYTTLDKAAAGYRQNSVLSDQTERRIELALLGNYGVAAPNTSELIYTVQNKVGTEKYIIGQAVTAQQGSLTEAIRNYNIARNYYALNSSIDIVEAQSNLEAILNNIYNTTPGGSFAKYSHNEQGLGVVMAYTNAGLGNGATDKPKEKTNTSPNSLQSYLGNPGGTGQQFDAVDILKPNSFYVANQSAPNYSAGTAGSMMAQTQVSEIISSRFLKGETAPDKDSYGTTTRGVRNILNVISQEDNIPIAQNYVRGQNEFVVGIQENSPQPRLSYQKYTYKNPYAANMSDTKQLNFSIRNYASSRTMYFPPYIKSYRHDASANWISHEFLGRPEPVYTYNNGNRTGSISFIVLTDYAQSVQYGSMDSSGKSLDPYATDFNFTNPNPAFQKDELNAAIIKDQNYINTLKNAKVQTANDKQEITNAITRIAGFQQTLKNITNNIKKGNPYNEFVFSDYSKSISSAQQDILSQVDTKKYLDDVIKNLLFIPSYFSGSKVDFVNKMDFLQKTTRPARSAGGTGFMFTVPPVCHIKLGDWFDWDVIIENVSCDYTDATWALDGKVQPMFATVDLSFKIVGSYGGGGTPVLATDIGGFFNPKQNAQNEVATGSKATIGSQTATPNATPTQSLIGYMSMNPGGGETFI